MVVGRCAIRISIWCVLWRRSVASSWWVSVRGVGWGEGGSAGGWVGGLRGGAVLGELAVGNGGGEVVLAGGWVGGVGGGWWRVWDREAVNWVESYGGRGG